MAEFCVQCWNRINGTDDPPSKFIISKDLQLCEGCGEFKNIVIMERSCDHTDKFQLITFPLKAVYILLFVLWRILISPYSFYKYMRNK